MLQKLGEMLTKWERKELGISSRVAQIRLTKELKELNKPLESGYSRVQMGSVRAREIEANIKRLKSLEKKSFKDFDKLKKTIITMGGASYSYNKATLWKKNYIETMQKYSHLDNFKLLESKFDSLSNPLAFYDFFSQDELGGDLTYQSDNTYTQQAFNSLLERLGLYEMQDTETISQEE